MAMTLVDFWQNEVTAYQTLATELQATLASAQAALDTVKTARLAAQAMLAQTGAAVSALEAKLAADTVPSDVDADSKQLRKLLAQQRAQSGAVSQQVDAELDAQLTLEITRESAAAVAAELSAAVAGKANADANAAAQAAWVIALAQPPLSTLVADANAAKSGTEQTAAKARIDHDFPPGLQTLATHRHDAQKARFDALRAAYDAAVALAATTFPTSSGREQSIDAAQEAYDATRARLAEWVNLAKSRLDAAVGMFVAIANAPALSAAEVADAASGPYVADAPTQAASTARDDARSTAWTDQITLDNATVTAYAADPTAAPATIAANPAVSGATAALNGATTALAPLEVAFNGGPPPTAKDKLGLWEAALPDSAYRSLANYQLANDLLNGLGSATPATLLTTLSAQEDTLATALQGAAQAQRSALFLQEILKLQSKRVQHAELVIQDRLFGAVRGDL